MGRNIKTKDKMVPRGQQVPSHLCWASRPGYRYPARMQKPISTGHQGWGIDTRLECKNKKSCILCCTRYIILSIPVSDVAVKARERELAKSDENRRAVGIPNPMRDENEGKKHGEGKDTCEHSLF